MRWGSPRVRSVPKSESERETIAETAGIENNSVPIEYLPRHTHGLLPYPVQHAGADAASGAVRGGTWHVDSAGVVSWTYVLTVYEMQLGDSDKMPYYGSSFDISGWIVCLDREIYLTEQHRRARGKVRT